MTERPILFSAPMVRALLAGTKTQTRRIVKPQPAAAAQDAGVIYTLSGPRSASHGAWFWLDDRDMDYASPIGDEFRCPYGVLGDTLWVKERHRFDVAYDHLKPTRLGTLAAVFYEAGGQFGDGVPGKSRASIHMRRCFSRITLQITDVRVERLQDISYEDCRDEGTICPIHGEVRHVACSGLKQGYRDLWEQINGSGSWEDNPWVWAVSFERVE